MKKTTLMALALLATVSIAQASAWSDLKDKAQGKWDRFKEDPVASLQRGRDQASGYAETASSAVQAGQGLYDQYGTTVFGEEGSTGIRGDAGAIAAQALGTAATATSGATGLLGTKKQP